MASLPFDATTSPTDVKAALNLQLNIRYRLQNIGPGPTLYHKAAATAPEPGDPSFRLESGSDCTVIPNTDEGIWVWTNDPAGCPVILDHAV